MAISFGAIFYDLVTEAGYTLESFAAEVGLTKGYLSQVKTGTHTPTIDRVREWGAKLGVKGDQLDYLVELAELNRASEAVQHLVERLRREIAERDALQPDQQLVPLVVREQGSVYLAMDLIDHHDSERPVFNPKEPRSLAMVGEVAAGDGFVSYLDEPRTFKIKASWAIMRVNGNSAYPVVYPSQFVVVDTQRPVRHNNLVVIQTDDRRAFLKRYCKTPDAPNGYVLASVNSGLDSPWIPHDKILVMIPVVGVLFENGEE